MVELKTPTKWLILKRFQHVIDCLLHISGLKYAEEKGAKMQAASDLTQSAKIKMVDGLSGRERVFKDPVVATLLT
ncbi:hypothetical protein [Cyclobacterium marinum]|uniref:Uncharacterized protein n=1 Tax=Cyclobacterium marinum (strain ATCC 25205 / DSM 745 / LMG 13164 / NCIMB 1802) TaxID=880070 RepID=G0J0B0_CYCMS|nr:hypothetical protein [Cyclobacterium marinum]AEL28183.1 hypothetical protein Cycma_4484 [Cyclobacterium marinum DSM 745]